MPNTTEEIVEIDEPTAEVEEVEVEYTAEDINDLSPEEKAMAKEEGLIPEKEEKKDPDAEPETEEEKAETKEYSANEKALYREMKQYRKRAQEAEETAKRTGFVAAKSMANTKKLREVQAIIDKIDAGEQLTTAEMRQAIGTIEDIPEGNTQTEAQKQYINAKSENVQAAGNKLYTDFDAVTKMALEGLSNEDAARLTQYMNDPSVSARKVSEYIGDLARKNPNFADDSEVLNPATKADRNANRQRTSAALSTGATSRKVNVHDMTPEDLGKLPQEEFERLDKKYPHVIKKILQRI